MKTPRTSKKVITALLLVSVLLVMASCTLLTGSLSLKSFTVDRSTVKTAYYVGEEIDFSGIQATAVYSDESLTKVYTFDELTITYDDDITATPGQKTVTVSFLDPNLNVEQKAYVQITVSEDPNAPKHAGYEVDCSGMKTTYFVGEDVDFTGVKVIEKFTNGGADVEMTDLTKISYSYSTDITAAPGSKNIVVTYDGKSAGAITVTVKYPAITETLLNSENVKTEYMAGDVLDLSGLTLTVSYENGETRTVTDFTADTLDMSTAGEKTVIVHYLDPISGVQGSDSFTVKVDAIESYTVDTSGMTLTYFEGDTVSFDGIAVTAVYHFGRSESVPFASLTFVHEQNITATPGQKPVEVKIGDVKIGEFVVAVGDIIATPTLNTEGVKLNYKQGEALDLTGLTLTVTYNDGTPAVENIPLTELTIVSSDISALTKEGAKNGKSVNVSIAYTDAVTGRLYVYLTIKVYSPTYSISSMPDKTTYYVGETIDYTGLVVVASYAHLEGVTETVDPSKVTVAGGTVATSSILKAVNVGTAAAGNISITVLKNEIASITVGGSFDTSYEVGETPDFTGLTITVTYLSGKVVELGYDKLTVGTVDTSLAGTKTVAVSFTDEVNNETAGATFQVTVIEAKPTVTQFEKPGSLTSFDSDNKNAGTLNYGDTGFSGQFLNGGKLYTIGDDNEFRLNPLFSVLDNGSPKSLSSYYTDVDIYYHDGSEYVLLEKTQDPQKPTMVSYYLGSELFAVVDTYNGLYSFKAVAEKIKISVLPSDEYYILNNTNPLVLEARVIDAYNVYEAWQLAVIDNYTGRDDWNAFKADKGLTGVSPAGIVIHNDIHISASDVPASFFNVSKKDVTYYKIVDGEVVDTSVAPEGTKYLIDGTFIYRRTGSSDFVIEGNFFAIDTRNFPLIASPAVFDADLDLDYGDDYSNATLFMFEAISSNWTPVAVPEISIENITFIGNASRDNWVDGETDGNLVTAGGLILLKSARYASTAMTNTVNNSFFIAYFPDYSGTLSVTDSKCYDSYQNSAFVWADSTLNIENSYINGSGGPVIISQSVKENVNGTESYYSPVTTVNGSVIETHVTGEEVWFKAVGATGIVGNIKALGGGLDQLVSTVTGAMGNTVNATWVDSQGKMNIKAILMPRGSSTDALTDGMIQGTATFDGIGVERWYEATENFEAEWAAILQNSYFQAGAPFLTAVGPDGTAHTIYFVQEGESGTFYDMNGLAIGTGSPDTAAIITAFATADQVVLHQGGLSAVFELYH
ncbi:MAG: bacterial Ig-like domain-containing protein [Clostridia bacterium]|nr:bacterial Ig-like domain-containing protein [Clostridia bacterium]